MDTSRREADTETAAMCRDCLTELDSSFVGLTIVEKPVESLLFSWTLGIDPTLLIGAIVVNIDAAMWTADLLRMHRLVWMHVWAGERPAL